MCRNLLDKLASGRAARSEGQKQLLNSENSHTGSRGASTLGAIWEQKKGDLAYSNSLIIQRAYWRIVICPHPRRYNTERDAINNGHLGRTSEAAGLKQRQHVGLSGDRHPTDAEGGLREQSNCRRRGCRGPHHITGQPAGYGSKLSGRTRETSKSRHLFLSLSWGRPATNPQENGGKDSGRGLCGFFRYAAGQRQSQIPSTALGRTHTSCTARRSRRKQTADTGLSDMGTMLLHVRSSGGRKAPRKIHATHGILNWHGKKRKEVQMAILGGLWPKF